MSKLFNCVFIAKDSNNVNKVRFANNLEKRKQTLLRDNFVISYSNSFDKQLTKEEILDRIDENQLSVEDFVAYTNARKQFTSNSSVNEILTVYNEVNTNQAVSM